jgi:hypothetical protein
MQRWVEGTFFNAEDFVGYAMDVQRDSIAVHGAVSERAQYEKRQRALQQVILGLIHRSLLASYK